MKTRKRIPSDYVRVNAIKGSIPIKTKIKIPVSFGQHPSHNHIVTIETDSNGKIIDDSCDCKEYALHGLCGCILRAHDILNGEWPLPPLKGSLVYGPEVCIDEWSGWGRLLGYLP